MVEDLTLDFDYKKLRSKIRLSNPNNTRILQISVTDTDPARAKKITDSVATCASEYIADIMEQDPPKIIEYGEIPTQKTAPSNSRNGMLGALLAILCVLGFLTVNVVMNDTVKTEDDIRRAIGSSVLAVVPMHSDESDPKRHRHRHHNKKPEKDDSKDLGGGV